METYIVGINSYAAPQTRKKPESKMSITLHSIRDETTRKEMARVEAPLSGFGVLHIITYETLS